MTIWLISPYGPIPGEGWREYRFAILGRALADAGHNVIWWTPNFSHHYKNFRSKGWADKVVQTRFLLRLVPCSGYTSNISFGRLKYEAVFAKNVLQQAPKEAAPQCIIATEPPQLIGRLGVKLAQQFQCPLIFDVMDQWPELFTLAFPRSLRGLARVLFLPLKAWRRNNYRHADGLLSLCETYRAAALQEVPKLAEVPNATIFNGIGVSELRAMQKKETIVPAQLPPKEETDVWAVYAGTLGNNYDVATLLNAARICGKTTPNLRFVVAGAGPLVERVLEYLQNGKYSNLSYLGPLRPDQLSCVYRQCDIGLCTYAEGSNVAMPDKAYDYMAAGLPIINSLRGELASVLEREGAGVQYQAGNANSLASCLQALTADGEQRMALSQRSYQLAEVFDRDRQCRDLPFFIQRVCERYANGNRPFLQEAQVA
jgi:glycosyltransferase involved in cell wall biosynthesis